MSGCEASLEKASTAPGLVVWSSSVTSLSCLPSAPPALLTRSSAIFAPVSAYLPESAAGPVTGSTMPILIVASSARAARRIAGAASVAASPKFTLRLVSLKPSSRYPRRPGDPGLRDLEGQGDAREGGWQGRCAVSDIREAMRLEITRALVATSARERGRRSYRFRDLEPRPMSAHFRRRERPDLGHGGKPRLDPPSAGNAHGAPGTRENLGGLVVERPRRRAPYNIPAPY